MKFPYIPILKALSVVFCSAVHCINNTINIASLNFHSREMIFIVAVLVSGTIFGILDAFGIIVIPNRGARIGITAFKVVNLIIAIFFSCVECGADGVCHFINLDNLNQCIRTGIMIIIVVCMELVIYIAPKIR